MSNTVGKIEIELICVIVNNDYGSKIIKVAKQHGVMGGTVFLGKGTIKNRILELLDLNDIRKEIVLMAAEKETAYQALQALNKEFSFKKPNHGIAFSTSIADLIGVHRYSDIKENRGEEFTMYQAIYAIVDKGKAEMVVDAAIKAGARGGTIINARGSGIHETSKLFSMDIEPEREIVLILCESKLSEQIACSIKDDLKMDDPGNGVIFIQSVNKAYGLY